MANQKELFQNHVFKSRETQIEFLIAEGREYLNPHASALDIGCGTGDYLAELLDSDLIEHGTGIDLSRKNIQTAAEDFPIEKLEFITGDYFKTPFKKPFDTIVSNSAIQYQKVNLKKLAKDLAPGGTLILYTPYFSLKNCLKNSMRFFICLFPKFLVEPAAFLIMKWFYSDLWTEAELRERLVYVHAKIYFMMGKSEIRQLEKMGIQLKKAVHFKKVTSFWKLHHGFFVFRKTEPTA